MLRTQIYLPEEFHSQLNDLADKLDLSMGAVIRMILKKGLQKKEEIMTRRNDLWKLANLKIKGGPKDLSKKLDYYLYG